MKFENCYKASLRLYELSEELNKLLTEKQKSNDINKDTILDKKISIVENEFLEIKDKLKSINY